MWSYNDRGNCHEHKVNGKLHNDGEPAVVYKSGTPYHKLYGDTGGAWYFEGKRHRFGGPAQITSTGVHKYFIYGIEVTKKEHDDLMKDLLIECYSQSDLEKMILKMRNKKVP